MCDVYLKVNNGMYVCAESGGGHPLAANRRGASLWEKFTLLDATTKGAIDPTKYAKGDHFVIRTFGNHFVKSTMDADNNPVLTASGSAAAADAESFEIVQIVDDHVDGKDKLKKPVGETDRRVSLRSVLTGKYVCAEQGGGQRLVVNRDHVGSWELFWLEIVSAP